MAATGNVTTGQLYFEIQADDVPRAAAFYRQVFGWQAERDERLPIEYWRIQTGATGGALIKRPAQTPPPECGTNAFVCSLQVDDFDAVAARIAGAGGQVALEKFAVPATCWQGYFIDTEGNTFGIFEVDESAA